jgi:predicted Zn-dependent protease
MLTRDEALKICETLLAEAKTAGAEDASVTLNNSIQSHARVAENRITTSGRADDLQITAAVWVGRRRGSVSGNDVSAAALKRMATDAVQIARVSPVHREYVPTLGPLEYDESRSFADATAAMDLNARAAALEAVLESCRRAKVTGAGFHMVNASASAGATANGNRRYFRTSEGNFSLTARSGDGTGSGYFAGDHFDLARLNVPQIAEQAVNKAVRSQQPKAIEPGTYSVILEPQAVADLLGFLGNSLDARSAEEGRSAFAAKDGKTRLGEQIFSERINLYSDPRHPELPAVPVTSEGLPATRLPLITKGVLQHLEYSRFWAQERKREATAGPVNYILESSQPAVPVEQMIKDTKRGLLISRFWYVRLVDPRTIVLTGLTRDGLWLVENGEVRHPVRNLRFNQSVLAMLAPWNVEAIGAPVRRSPFMVPPLRLASFTFTSMSDAI